MAVMKVAFTLWTRVNAAFLFEPEKLAEKLVEGLKMGLTDTKDLL